MQHQTIVYGSHFVLPGAKGTGLLLLSWTLSIWTKHSLNLEFSRLLIHISPTELVGVLSGLGSFGLSVITAWHYLARIRDMRRNERKDQDSKEKTNDNGKGEN